VAGTLNWNTILHENSLGVQVFTCDEQDIDAVALTAPEGTVTRIVRGQRCVSKERTLQEWAAAFQFPSYFGNNWDAFEECLNDLAWLNARQVVAFVTRADAMVPRSPGAFAMLLEILAAAEKNSGFRAVLQCSPARADALHRRITKARKNSSGR
jgi:hypothetical protein